MTALWISIMLLGEQQPAAVSLGLLLGAALIGFCWVSGTIAEALERRSYRRRREKQTALHMARIRDPLSGWGDLEDNKKP